jgi:hypothetical protein
MRRLLPACLPVLASTALAVEPSPVTSVVLSPLPGCVYGLPVAHGELWLVPRACRLQLDGRWLDRQTVEVRRGSTRVTQASLPPMPASADPAQGLPPPGEVLPGSTPLWVLPHGIAAVDTRQGRAEWMFEAPGSLLAVARHGDLLALAESATPDNANTSRLQLTVLDLEAGDVIGETRLAGDGLTDLRLASGDDGRVDLLVERSDARRRQQIVLPVQDKAGDRSHALKQARARDLNAAPASPPPGEAACPALAERHHAVTARPALSLPTAAGQAVHLRPDSQLPWRGLGRCLALGVPGPDRRSWVWLEVDGQGRSLREVKWP